MQRELFEVLAEAKSREDLKRIEPRAWEVARRYMDELDDAYVRELAIRRIMGRLNYSRRCAEASAMEAHLKREVSLALGMEIDYMVKDAKSLTGDNVSNFSSTSLENRHCTQATRYISSLEIVQIISRQPLRDGRWTRRGPRPYGRK